MQAEKLDKVSIEEYIAIEKANDTKYEYHDGSIYAMAGGTLNHALICGNVFGNIFSSLKEKNKNCTVINSEAKLRVESKNSYVYPDSMVICGDIETSDKKPDAITNPVVIIEVLSKSTADYDRGDKFYLYRQIKSLKEYILIEQNISKIDIHTKKGDLWKISRVEGLDRKLFISALDMSIDLSAIYQGIVFPTKP